MTALAEFEMPKIFMIHNERQKFSDRAVQWKGHEIHFSPFGFEEMIGRPNDGRDELFIYESVLQNVCERIDDYDAVWCEDPEAMLLQFFRRRQGRREIPFAINLVDRLKRLSSVGEWLQRHYGENPVADFLRREKNSWFYMTKSFAPFYERAGIPGGKMQYLACSTYLLNFIDPDLFQWVGDQSEEAASPRLEPFRNKFVAAGSNSRDYGALLEAAKSFPDEVHIICDLSRFHLKPPKNVIVHDFLPLRDYLQVLKRARCVVVTLRPSISSGGENTTSFSLAVGAPLIVTRTEPIEDFLEDGKNCLMVPPGDAQALRQAMVRLRQDPELAGRLSEEGRKTERHLCDLCERNTMQTFERALCGRV